MRSHVVAEHGREELLLLGGRVLGVVESGGRGSRTVKASRSLTRGLSSFETTLPARVDDGTELGKVDQRSIARQALSNAQRAHGVLEGRWHA